MSEEQIIEPVSEVVDQIQEVKQLSGVRWGDKPIEEISTEEIENFLNSHDLQKIHEMSQIAHNFNQFSLAAAEYLKRIM